MSDPAERLIEVRLNQASQLFNSMDPSPFHERDLDREAEAFVVGWARELPRAAPLRIRVTLRECRDDALPGLIRDSVRNYFAHRSAQLRREVRHLLEEGRTSLLIGLGFLAVTFAASRLLPAEPTWAGFLREGLTICGWVGLWRPIEIHLYRWWPIRREAELHRRLSEAPVEVEVVP